MNYELHLKEVRLSRGMTQQELAFALRVTQSAVAQWESGTTKPTTTNIVALTQALHCSLDELVRPKATAIAPA